MNPVDSPRQEPGSGDAAIERETAGSAKAHLHQYSLRLPRDLYLDVFDVAGLFGMSVNQFLLQAVREYVETQLRQEANRSAINQVREARRARGIQPP